MPSRIEKILVFLLVLLLPSQLGIHFWPSWSYFWGLRLDYLSPTLYFTDILILILFLTSGYRVRVRLPVIIFVVFNILISISPLVTIYRWFRILEYYWLFKYIISNPGWKFSLISLSLSLSLIWTSLLAWFQLIRQSSTGGLWYWLGERTFNIATPGISKINLEFTDWNLGLLIRPYATFPHPNALAGFLLVGSLLLYYLRPKSLISNISYLISMVTIPITFSRTAIFLEVLMLVLFLISKISNFRFKTGIFIASALLLFSSSTLLPGNPTSLSERLTQYSAAIKLISGHFIFGVGLGSYIPAAFPYYQPITNNYKLMSQPVHNIFILLACEIGIPALLILIYYLIRSLHRRSLIFIAVVVVSGLIDHYWITSHQNSLLLVLLFSSIILRNEHINIKHLL